MRLHQKLNGPYIKKFVVKIAAQGKAVNILSLKNENGKPSRRWLSA